MRINKYVALATGLSRRKADELILRGSVSVNGQTPSQGQDIAPTDVVKLGDRRIEIPASTTTIMLNKPPGYVVSREGQGSRTIYELLPPAYHSLKPIGRLDKNSSGLLLLTNDGNLANELTHPSKQKLKVYEISLYKPLTPQDRTNIEQGLQLEDGLSKLQLSSQADSDASKWVVTMSEGRNRQIRRTFAALNYEVKTLHRTVFDHYQLGGLGRGEIKEVS